MKPLMLLLCRQCPEREPGDVLAADLVLSVSQVLLAISNAAPSGKQVVREVAVLDNINPGGLYAARVKLLARQARQLPFDCQHLDVHIPPTHCTHLPDQVQRPELLVSTMTVSRQRNASMTLGLPVLSRFAPDAAVFPGHPSLEKEDIPDPLYAREFGDCDLSERERLRAAVAQIRAACAGLLRHLLDLSDRWPSLR